MSQKTMSDRMIGAMSEGLFERVAGSLAGDRQSAMRHQRSRLAYLEYMKKELGPFMQDVPPGPVGPKEIIMKTAVLNQEEAAWSLNPDNYFEYGYRQLLSWFIALKPHGFNLRTLSSALELGCGSARLIRHLRCIGGIRLAGTDLVPEQVAWCKENIPGVEFHVNELRPPLAFADDNSFDFAFAASVFTHIPLETQQLWIREMCRILRPGGFLVCDVLGEYHQRRMLSAADRERLEREGQLTLTATDANASLSTQLIGSWDVFMTRGEVLKAFATVFHVVDFLPTSLNLLILQKPGAPF